MTGFKFPGVNLILQLFRQLTKPLSTSIIDFAKSHPSFRQNFLITPGRYYHLWDSMMKIHFRYDRLNRNQSDLEMKKIKQIDESKAMEVGAQLMIETLVFLILATFVIYESSKSVAKSQMLEEMKEQDLAVIVKRKNDLTQRLEHQAALIQELRSRIHNYSKEVGYSLPRISESREHRDFPSSDSKDSK